MVNINESDPKNKPPVREINEWDIVTLAEMIAGLKTISAARFATERSKGTGVTPSEMIDGAVELLKSDYYSDNHGAADRTSEEVKGHLSMF